MSFVIHRVSKSAARYTDAGGREKCGYCRFFMAPRACGKVIGPVSPTGWCKYFSRQVAQQYSGAGITGGGGPPGATLALDFMSSGNLPPGVTFTRASTATYTDASGVIRTAATNAPRWDYAGGVLRGLLIEEQRTNIWLFSNDLSNAATGVGGVGIAGPTVTGNNTVAPDGNTTGARVLYPAVSSAGQSSTLQQSYAMTAAPYTFSVWLRGSVGGETVWLSTTPDGALYYRTQCVLTTAWRRFTLTTPNLTTAGWFWLIGVDRRDASQTSQPVQTVYAWGADIQQGAFPTSYISTASAAVTRAQDSCAIPPANMSPWFASPGGSWFAEFDYTTNPLTNSRVIGQPVPSGLTPLFMRTTNAGSQFDGGLSDTITTTAANVINKMVSTWMPGQAKIALNAGPVTTTAALTTGYGVFTTSGMAIFTTASSGPDNLSGHIRRVSYWPRALSDAEMQQVTT